MKNLLIAGAGQYGVLVREIAELTGEYNRISFIDDSSPDAIGKIKDYKDFSRDYTDAVVAIGNAEVRKRVFELLKNEYNMATVIHPKAWVSASAKIGSGCVLEPNCAVNSGAVIGDGCLIGACASVNHNATVANYCHIDCGAAVEACASVPDMTKVESCTLYKRC